MDTEFINIAFITDKNYTLCTSVAIYSLKVHRSQSRTYRVYVVYEGLDDQDIKQLESISEPNFTIICISAKEKVGSSKYDSKRYARHVSSAATYKFNLARILSDVDKLLYLDGDILIRDDLANLFDINIEGKYAAVCQDMGAETFPSNYRERLKIDHSFYFNTGVMLLNLKKIREEKLHQKLIDYRKNGINDYMDQDTFNVVFSENVVYFDVEYNMATSCWTKQKIEDFNSYYHKSYTSKSDCYKYAKILHLTTPEKPWKYNDVIASEEWIIYYLNSPVFANDFSRRMLESSKYKKLIEPEMDYYSVVSDIKTGISSSPIDSPEISVVIPVYNAKNYLPDCIDSLLFQSFSNAEYIFVDDSSDDDSEKIINIYTKLEPRIKLLRQNHGGAGKARNLGLDYTKGRYVTFLDSDDALLPSALERLHDRAREMEADITICNCTAFSDDKTVTRAYESSLKKNYLPHCNDFSAKTYPESIFQMTDGQAWGKLFKTDLIKENGILFPLLPRSEDIPFTYLALAVVDRITYTEDSLVLHRVITGSNSLEEAKDKTPTAVDSALCILWDKLKEIGLDNLLYKTFINKAVISYYYNFTTMFTAEGFERLYTSFKNSVNNNFNLPFEDESLFYELYKADYLKEIYNSDNIQSYLFQQLKNAEVENKYSRLLGEKYYDSLSYRIGRTITWLPRKIKGGIQCYKDNGMKYTVNRFFEHISGRT